MRVGELHQLEWRDVDVAGSRFRIRQGKTATARRAERRVFQGFTPSVLGNVMSRACKAAGIAHFSPHDLRHRYASVQMARGVPVTKVAAQLGHSRKSLTLDTYSHVLMGEGGDDRR